MNSVVSAASSSDAADDRHREEQHAEHDDQRRLQEADDDVGRDLAEHDLERADRHGEQALHGAALDLARHRQGGEDQHGHGQDGAEQARHDVEAGDGRRIVAPVLADLEGAGIGSGWFGQAAVARQRRSAPRLRARRARCRPRTGSLASATTSRAGRSPRPHAALEAGRDLDAEQHGARAHQWSISALACAPCAIDA